MLVKVDKLTAVGSQTASLRTTQTDIPKERKLLYNICSIGTHSLEDSPQTFLKTYHVMIQKYIFMNVSAATAYEVHLRTILNSKFYLT